MKERSYIQWLFFTLVLVMTNCRETIEDQALYYGASLQVQWELFANQFEGNEQHKSTLTIQNVGDKPIPAKWKLYWNQSPRNIVDGSYQSNGTISRLQGDLYQLTPAAETLNPGESQEYHYVSDVWIIKEGDAPTGAYVVWEDGSRQPIEVEIEPFNQTNQVTRGSTDNEAEVTAAVLYDIHKKLPPVSASVEILPTPRSIQKGSGQFEISNQTTLYAAQNLANEANQLKSSLEDLLNESISIVTEVKDQDQIQLSMDPNIAAEGYQLRVTRSGVIVSGGDAAGVFYGIQSLLQLFPISAYTAPSSRLEIPVMEIEDQPAFGYRGMHLDIARNFHGPTTIKRLLDVMAYYKMNRMLLHMTEDEGWRIEIPSLPELTKVGSKRGHISSEIAPNLQPSYGSGPEVDASSGSGYLSRSEFVDILRYAKDRHIAIIPEVNGPGHARAAIQSMKYRHQRLLADGETESADQFLLHDPDDRSEYSSAQMYNDNTLCVCRESVYDFYETVLDDIIAMYQEADAPIVMIHTGGDEVPRGAWEGSPICLDFMDRHPQYERYSNLQSYYFERIHQMIIARGYQVAGWEEVGMTFLESGWKPTEQFADGSVVANVWNSIWGNQDLGYRLANAGYPIVLCNVNNFYFDLAYNKDPRERGLYWGGFVHTKDAFDFIPYNFYRSSEEDQMGNPFNVDEDFKDLPPLTDEGRKNVLGLQGQLWSELITDQDKLEYAYMPKVFGLAQRAWEGDAPWAAIHQTDRRQQIRDQSWANLAHRIGNYDLIKWSTSASPYFSRIPTPGGKIIDGHLHVNNPYPGFEIRYTLDGSEPTIDDPAFTQPIQVDQNSTIRIRSFDRNGRAGLSIHVPVRQPDLVD